MPKSKAAAAAALGRIAEGELEGEFKRERGDRISRDAVRTIRRPYKRAMAPEDHDGEGLASARAVAETAGLLGHVVGNRLGDAGGGGGDGAGRDGGGEGGRSLFRSRITSAMLCSAMRRALLPILAAAAILAAERLLQGNYRQWDQNLKTRDYLNSEVAASVADNNQESNIVFVKTHKTGGTTLAALLVRYAQRHNIKAAWYPASGPQEPLAQIVPKILEACGGPVDVMPHHVIRRAEFSPPWEVTDKLYRRVMRGPDNINYVTLLREPREHLISFYYFFYEHTTEVSIQDFLASASTSQEEKDSKLSNLLAREFGLRDPAEVEEFVGTVLPTFKLVMLTESFDDGLSVLRHLMRWHLIDMAYVTVNESKKVKSSWRSTDGNLIEGRRPRFDDLPREVQDQIDQLTLLDRTLYDGAKAVWGKTLELFKEEVAEDRTPFAQLQDTVGSFLASNPESLAHALYGNLTNVVSRHPYPPDATFPF